jgi:hypothetical protein
MDPDADPTIFVSDLQDINKKLFYFLSFVFASYFSKVHLQHFLKIKRHKEVASMKFWCGSGSSDPYLCLMDPDADPDPAIFVSDLQDINKK